MSGGCLPWLGLASLRREGELRQRGGPSWIPIRSFPVEGERSALCSFPPWVLSGVPRQKIPSTQILFGPICGSDIFKDFSGLECVRVVQPSQAYGVRFDCGLI